MKRYKFYQYPRGQNNGGVLDVEICPTISCSSWQYNCFLIEYEEVQDMAQTPRILRGGILEPLIFPTITTRTGDADIDLIVEIYEQQETCKDDKGGENPK